MQAFRAAVAAASFAVVGGVHAAELKIVDVKAYAFLEHAGKLSDDLFGAPMVSSTRRKAARRAATPRPDC